MPTTPTDLTGQRFGRLVAIHLDGFTQNAGGHRTYFWQCICDCGTKVRVRAGNMRNGSTQSCGCLHRERASEASKRHGRSLNVGRSATRRDKVYSTWKGMRQRCRDPKCLSYAIYGGRGIKVCERWDTFENFLADVGEPPSPDMTIDRIDVDGNYEPGNVRWATRKEQRANTRKAKADAAA